MPRPTAPGCRSWTTMVRAGQGRVPRAAPARRVPRVRRAAVSRPAGSLVGVRWTAGRGRVTTPQVRRPRRGGSSGSPRVQGRRQPGRRRAAGAAVQGRAAMQGRRRGRERPALPEPPASTGSSGVAALAPVTVPRPVAVARSVGGRRMTCRQNRTRAPGRGWLPRHRLRRPVRRSRAEAAADRGGPRPGATRRRGLPPAPRRSRRRPRDGRGASRGPSRRPPYRRPVHRDQRRRRPPPRRPQVRGPRWREQGREARTPRPAGGVPHRPDRTWSRHRPPPRPGVAPCLPAPRPCTRPARSASPTPATARSSTCARRAGEAAPPTGRRRCPRHRLTPRPDRRRPRPDRRRPRPDRPRPGPDRPRPRPDRPPLRRCRSPHRPHHRRAGCRRSRDFRRHVRGPPCHPLRLPRIRPPRAAGHRNRRPVPGVPGVPGARCAAAGRPAGPRPIRRPAQPRLVGVRRPNQGRGRRRTRRTSVRPVVRSGHRDPGPGKGTCPAGHLFPVVPPVCLAARRRRPVPPPLTAAR